MKTISKTLNFHLTKACNYRCGFCFTTFEDLKEKGLSKEEHFAIIEMIAESPDFDKINFTGREPTLVKHLPELIEYAKKLGLKTGMITNGALLTDTFLLKVAPNLESIIISIDSFYHETNLKIGRSSRNQTLDFQYYLRLSKFFKDHYIKFKVNTVANRYNINEVLTDKINILTPERWKIQRVTRIDGQNEKKFQEFAIDDLEFQKFVERNEKHLSKTIKLSKFDTEDVMKSYILMDPLGRLYTDSNGHHTYTASVLDISLETALLQLKTFLS